MPGQPPGQDTGSNSDQTRGQGTGSGDVVDPGSPGRGLIRNGSFNGSRAKPIPRKIPDLTPPDSKPGRTIKSPKL